MASTSTANLANAKPPGNRHSATQSMRARLPLELIDVILSHLLRLYIPIMTQLVHEVEYALQRPLKCTLSNAPLRKLRIDMRKFHRDAYSLCQVFTAPELAWTVRDFLERIMPLVDRMLDAQMAALAKLENERKARQAWYDTLGEDGWLYVEEWEKQQEGHVSVPLRGEILRLKRGLVALLRGIGGQMGDVDVSGVRRKFRTLVYGPDEEARRELRRSLGIDGGQIVEGQVQSHTSSLSGTGANAQVTSPAW